MDTPSLLKDRYRIQKTLGQGGFATTYLALDQETERPCVVKFVSLKGTDTFKTLELFEREAKILAHLDHPQVPRFIDYFTVETAEDLQVYLVEEFIQGENLADQVQAGKHFTEKEVLRIAIDIARVLVYIHGCSPPLIHRDIKPKNIILSPGKRAHLVDFGAVRDKMLQDRTQGGGGSTVVGTYGYMPFEQFEGRALPASDIYALGATLVYVLSHKEPLQLEQQGMRLDFRPHVNISPAFADVLDKMLQPDWQQRYQSALELKRDLEQLIEGKRPAGPPAMPLPQALVIGLGIIVALVAAGTLTFLTRARKQEGTAPPAVTAAVRTPPAIQVQPSPRQEVGGTPGPTVKGQLFYDGRPLAEFTRYQPHFWFRNEDSNKVVADSPSIQYDSATGRFTVPGLPAGHLGLSVDVDANPENPRMYPGDFKTFQMFTASGDSTPELAVNLQRIIHLTSPQDNGTEMERWGERCLGKMAFSSPMRFAWESLGDNVYYDYSVQRIQCPYTSKGKVQAGTTSHTEVTLALPPSRDNEFYLLTLMARKEGRSIGMLMTHGASGYGWDYRFRVAE